MGSGASTDSSPTKKGNSNVPENADVAVGPSHSAMDRITASGAASNTAPTKQITHEALSPLPPPPPPPPPRGSSGEPSKDSTAHRTASLEPQSPTISVLVPRPPTIAASTTPPQEQQQRQQQQAPNQQVLSPETPTKFSTNSVTSQQSREVSPSLLLFPVPPSAVINSQQQPHQRRSPSPSIVSGQASTGSVGLLDVPQQQRQSPRVPRRFAALSVAQQSSGAGVISSSSTTTEKKPSNDDGERSGETNPLSLPDDRRFGSQPRAETEVVVVVGPCLGGGCTTERRSSSSNTAHSKMLPPSPRLPIPSPPRRQNSNRMMMMRGGPIMIRRKPSQEQLAQYIPVSGESIDEIESRLAALVLEQQHANNTPGGGGRFSAPSPSSCFLDLSQKSSAQQQSLLAEEEVPPSPLLEPTTTQKSGGGSGGANDGGLSTIHLNQQQQQNQKTTQQNCRSTMCTTSIPLNDKLHGDSDADDDSVVEFIPNSTAARQLQLFQQQERHHHDHQEQQQQTCRRGTAVMQPNPQIPLTVSSSSSTTTTIRATTLGQKVVPRDDHHRRHEENTSKEGTTGDDDENGVPIPVGLQESDGVLVSSTAPGSCLFGELAQTQAAVPLENSPNHVVSGTTLNSASEFRSDASFNNPLHLTPPHCLSDATQHSTNSRSQISDHTTAAAAGPHSQPTMLMQLPTSPSSLLSESGEPKKRVVCSSDGGESTCTAPLTAPPAPPQPVDEKTGEDVNGGGKKMNSSTILPCPAYSSALTLHLNISSSTKCEEASSPTTTIGSTQTGSTMTLLPTTPHVLNPPTTATTTTTITIGAVGTNSNSSPTTTFDGNQQQQQHTRKPPLAPSNAKHNHREDSSENSTTTTTTTTTAPREAKNSSEHMIVVVHPTLSSGDPHAATIPLLTYGQRSRSKRPSSYWEHIGVSEVESSSSSSDADEEEGKKKKKTDASADPPCSSITSGDPIQ